MIKQILDEADMVLKNTFCEKTLSKNIKLLFANVETKSQSLKMGLEKGNYYILEAQNIATANLKFVKTFENYVQKYLTKLIENTCPNCDKVLMVGLGNERLSADSLGSKVLNKILISSSFEKKIANKQIYALYPDVYTKTGIESFVIIKAIVEEIKPDFLIIIDSLATKSLSRLGTSFQLSNTSITPGGALHNFNRELSEKTLKVPCICIGIPLMLISNYIDEFGDKQIFTPKEIEVMSNRCAKILADAINRTLFNDLSNQKILEMLNY